MLKHTMIVLAATALLASSVAPAQAFLCDNGTELNGSFNGTELNGGGLNSITMNGGGENGGGINGGGENGGGENGVASGLKGFAIDGITLPPAR